MKYSDFFDLDVWKEAKDIVIRVYRITRDFPKEEGYGLTSQLRRASSSVCVNIAEGFSRFHTKDKIRFYYNARGSISESMNHVMIAVELSYLEPIVAGELIDKLRSTRKMLNAMINSIASSSYNEK